MINRRPEGSNYSLAVVASFGSVYSWSVSEKSFLQSAHLNLRYILPSFGWRSPCLHSVGVARYAALIQAKSPANCDAHLAESIFQTRSKTAKLHFSLQGDFFWMYFLYSTSFLAHHFCFASFNPANSFSIFLYVFMDWFVGFTTNRKAGKADIYIMRLRASPNYGWVVWTQWYEAFYI